MINVYANIPAVVVARVEIDFEAAGLNASNTEIIYKVGSPLQSWNPNRSINPIEGFEPNQGYYIVPKQDLNLSAIAAAPIELPSNKKNIRIASSGSYSFAGEWAPGRTGPARRSWFGRVNAAGHMDGGKPGGLDMNEFTRQFSAIFEFPIVQEKQNDDVTNLLQSNGQRSIFFGETDHGVINGGTTWDMHPKRYPIDGNHNVLGPGVPITGGDTGIEQLQYEWNYGKFKSRPGEPNKIFGSLIQLNIDAAPVDRKKFSCYRSIDGGVTFQAHTIYEATSSVARSETDVIPVPGSNYVFALIRLDQGGQWQMWVSADDGLTFPTFLGNTNLGWIPIIGIVTKAAINNDGTIDFTIMDRGTGWLVRSTNNDVLAQGSLTDGIFNEIELYYYNDTGDAHDGLGYDSQYQDEDGIKHLIWAEEQPSNLTTNLLYTADDEIDEELPADIPELFSSFVTATSFRVDIDLTQYTNDQKVKWNTRFFRVSLCSDEAGTTPIEARYSSFVGKVLIDSIRWPSHFGNFDQLDPGSGPGNKDYYVFFEAWNNLGANPTKSSLKITIV